MSNTKNFNSSISFSAVIVIGLILFIFISGIYSAYLHRPDAVNQQKNDIELSIRSALNIPVEVPIVINKSDWGYNFYDVIITGNEKIIWNESLKQAMKGDLYILDKDGNVLKRTEQIIHKETHQ